MAFQEVEKGVWGAGREATTNQCAVWVGATGISTLTISGDIFAKIGSPVFARLLIGSGEHEGRIALIPRSMPGSATYKVTQTGTKSKQRKVIVTATKIGLPSDKRPSTVVPHQITDDGLILDLRDISSEIAPRQPKRSAPRVIAAA